MAGMDSGLVRSDSMPWEPGCEAEHRVGQEVDRGLEPARQEDEQEGDDLLMGELLAADLATDEIARHIVGRRRLRRQAW